MEHVNDYASFKTADAFRDRLAVVGAYSGDFGDGIELVFHG